MAWVAGDVVRWDENLGRVVWDDKDSARNKRIWL
jgi:hypothetical protein